MSSSGASFEQNLVVHYRWHTPTPRYRWHTPPPPCTPSPPTDLRCTGRYDRCQVDGPGGWKQGRGRQHVQARAGQAGRRRTNEHKAPSRLVGEAGLVPGQTRPRGIRSVPAGRLPSGQNVRGELYRDVVRSTFSRIFAFCLETGCVTSWISD